jgi:hypothetical protein
MLNHIILTTIVGLLGVGIHLWMRHVAKRGEPLSSDIERWEDDGGPPTAHSR